MTRSGYRPDSASSQGLYRYELFAHVHHSRLRGRQVTFDVSNGLSYLTFFRMRASPQESPGRLFRFSKFFNASNKIYTLAAGNFTAQILVMTRTSQAAMAGTFPHRSSQSPRSLRNDNEKSLLSPPHCTRDAQEPRSGPCAYREQDLRSARVPRLNLISTMKVTWMVDVNRIWKSMCHSGKY